MHNICYIGSSYPNYLNSYPIDSLYFVHLDHLEPMKHVLEIAHVIILNGNAFSENSLSNASLLRSQHNRSNQVWIYIVNEQVNETIEECYTEGFDNAISLISHEVYHSILRAEVLFEQRKQSEVQLILAQKTAQTALMNSSELGSLIKLLTDIIKVKNPASLAFALIHWFRQHGLCVCLQLRGNQKRYEFSSNDIIRPIESELLNKGESGDRIVKIGKRYLFNETHLSILIKNMPINEPEFLGRLNDHIATICHSCESAIDNVLNENPDEESFNTVELSKIKSNITDLNQEVFDYIISVRGRLGKLMKVMHADFSRLELTDEHQEILRSVISEYSSNMEEIDEMNFDIETKITRFEQNIQKI
ncbi:hypothetical protein NBRC116188_15030 [Oceaniserpentilla sp. 4NH20-0058]|uniref:hypothetical protein n=1 Tax=Oceaniserpentilla sp. 4NH20-0058 TaxID=3127660 RepID=UPI0031036FA3